MTINNETETFRKKKNKSLIRLRPTILLVEDNEIAQKIMREFFNDLVYALDIASCGKDAIKIFIPGKYSLIFLDIGLPDMRGHQVAEYFRELEKGTSHKVPILSCSSDKMHDRKKLADAGIVEILNKPLQFDEVKAVLKKYVTQ